MMKTHLIILTIIIGLTFVPVALSKEFHCGTAEIQPLLPVPDWDRILMENSSESDRVPTEYNVGDQRVVWTWDLSVMPPGFLETASTCRAKGEFGYVWVADADWNVNIFADDVQGVFGAWENSTPAGSVDPGKGIFEIATDTFGPVPDALDNDPRVHILFYEPGSFMGTTFDGFFNAFDQMTETQAQAQGQHSNECEILYLNADGPHTPADPYMLGVLAHEFQHMLHWLADSNEVTWVNEGCSQLSWYLCGYGTDGWETYFANHPNNDLTDFGVDGSYGQVMLFFLYLYQQFGGAETIYSIAQNPANGFDGIQAGIDAMGYLFDRDQVFADWCVANLIDHPGLDRSQYGYVDYDPPNFKITTTFTTYPTGTQSISIKRFAARYFRFQSGDPQLNITIDPSGYTARGVAARYDTIGVPAVMPLDPAFHRCQSRMSTADTLDFVMINMEDSLTELSVDLTGTNGMEADDTPPYVVEASPHGLDVRDKYLSITIMDELSDVSVESLVVIADGFPFVEPIIEERFDGNQKVFTVWVPLTDYYPNMDVNVSLTVQDDNGFEMSPFRMHFKTGDAMDVETGVILEMPGEMFTPGDICYLRAELGNGSAPMTGVPFFVLLEVFGTFYSAPAWDPINENLTWYTVDLPTGIVFMDIIPAFTWPDITGSVNGLNFYGAMTNASMTDLMGELDIVTFGWGN